MRSRIRSIPALLTCTSGVAHGQDFPQSFDNIGALTSPGNWFTRNNSDPRGPTDFFQGDAATFPAHASSGYLAANYHNTGPDVGTISNWFITPPLNLANGQHYAFFTRTITNNSYPDRLQVRLSTSGFSTDVGATATSVGDFGTLLLDINPSYLPSPAGYPDAWTPFSITITDLGAPTVGRIAFRYFVENAGPLGANSNYIGIDTATYDGTVAGVPTGSCCVPNGNCLTAQTQSQCQAQAGVYGGNGSACGTCTAFGYLESGDVGDLPATAAVVSGSGGLTRIVGTIAADDVDMYRVLVCDRPSFTATTAGGPSLDSVLYLFQLNGRGLAKDDEGASSENHALVTGQFVPANGEVYLAISAFERDAVESAGQRIWNETNPSGQYAPEWAPNGPGAANPVSSWFTYLSNPGGAYWITLTGACFIGTCSANCDGSTVAPVLSANDFQCFINKFAGNHPYANCDGSIGQPALTANDFQCFINAFAAGCP